MFFSSIYSLDAERRKHSTDATQATETLKSSVPFQPNANTRDVKQSAPDSHEKESPDIKEHTANESIPNGVLQDHTSCSRSNVGGEILPTSPGIYPDRDITTGNTNVEDMTNPKSTKPHDMDLPTNNNNEDDVVTPFTPKAGDRELHSNDDTSVDIANPDSPQPCKTHTDSTSVDALVKPASHKLNDIDLCADDNDIADMSTPTSSQSYGEDQMLTNNVHNPTDINSIHYHPSVPIAGGKMSPGDQSIKFQIPDSLGKTRDNIQKVIADVHSPRSVGTNGLKSTEASVVDIEKEVQEIISDSRNHTDSYDTATEEDMGMRQGFVNTSDSSVRHTKYHNTTPKLNSANTNGEKEEQINTHASQPVISPNNSNDGRLNGHGRNPPDGNQTNSYTGDPTSKIGGNKAKVHVEIDSPSSTPISARKDYSFHRTKSMVRNILPVNIPE